VVEDIPEIVERKRREHPQVRIRVTPYLGAAREVADLLASIAAAPA
jgi:hypothetical protein